MKSWERGAKLVKNTDVSNNYLEHIRDTHDPALHVKTLEDEIRGTMGKALGKQGEKVLYYMRLMAEERQKHDDLLRDGIADSPSHPHVCECAKRHNEFREYAEKARWELIVHRQAVGFIVNNHRFVMEKFPISDALPVHEGDEDSYRQQLESMEKKQQQQNQKHTGQLGWWERIGRWR